MYVNERRLDIISGSPFRNIWNELIMNFNLLFYIVYICACINSFHTFIKINIYFHVLISNKAICDFPIFLVSILSDVSKEAQFFTIYKVPLALNWHHNLYFEA